jgi:hypothetical protein
MKDMNKTTNMLNDNYDDIEEASEKIAKASGVWKKLLGGIGGLIKKIGIGFSAFSLFDVIKDTFVLNKNMTDLSYRMGEGTAGVQKLTKAVTDTAFATGVSTEKATEWVTVLTKLRVGTKDVTELSIASERFARITGASNDSISQLVGQLHTMGGLGSKDIKNVMRGIVSVQRRFGLTEESVTRLNESLIETTKSLKYLGKSSDEIAKFSMGVTKLAGAFVSVGMKAEDATKLIEKMLDPGQIEDNAMLYAKLGISMQDAIEGNINPEKMIGGLKGLKSEMAGMNRIAANELAKSMGFTYNQIMQMSEIDIAGNMGDAADVSADMSKEAEEQKVAQEKLTSSLNKFKSILVDIGSKFMPMINKAAGWLTEHFDEVLKKGKDIALVVTKFVKGLSKDGLMKLGMIVAGVGVALFVLFKLIRKKFFTLATDMGKHLSSALSTGIEESIDMGSEKATVKMEKRMNASTGRYTQNLQKRIVEGSAYAADQASATFYKTMSGTNLTKWGKGVAKWTGEWVDGLSYGAKPVGLIEEYVKKTQDKLKENVKLENENSFIRYNALKALKEESDTRKNLVNDRMEELKALKEAGKLTNSQEREFNRLKKESKKLGKESVQQEAELAKIEDQRQNRLRKNLAAMSEVERQRYADSLAKEQEISDNQKENLKQRKNDAELMLGVLERQQKTMNDSLLETEKILKNDDAGYEKKLKAGKLRQELLIEQKNNNELLREERSELEKVEAAHKEILKDDEKRVEIQEALNKKTGETDTNVLSKGAREKTKDFFESLGGSLMSKVHDGFNKITDSFGVAVKSGKELMSPKHWKEMISKAGDGSFIKGLGKVFKSGAGAFAKAGKMIGGPLLLFIGPLLKMLKDSQGFKKIMEKLKDTFKKVGEKLMPVFENLMDALMPVFDALIPIMITLVEKLLLPLVKALLPPLLTVLGFLLQALGKTIEAIGMLINKLGGHGDGLVTMGQSLQEAAGQLKSAAKDMKISFAIEKTMSDLVGVLGDPDLTQEQQLEVAQDQLRILADQYKEQMRQAAEGKSNEELIKMGFLTQEDINRAELNETDTDAKIMAIQKEIKGSWFLGTGAERAVKNAQSNYDFALSRQNDLGADSLSMNISGYDEKSGMATYYTNGEYAKLMLKELQDKQKALADLNEDLREARSGTIEGAVENNIKTMAEERIRSLTGGKDIDNLETSDLSTLLKNLQDSITNAITGDDEEENFSGTVEGVTRKLYPAIIQATSSGFVKTADAVEEISGSPEKVREAQQEETNQLLQAVIDGLNKGAAISLEQLEALKAAADNSKPEPAPVSS